jgi:hypothetical protein
MTGTLPLPPCPPPRQRPPCSEFRGSISSMAKAIFSEMLTSLYLEARWFA